MSKVRPHSVSVKPVPPPAPPVRARAPLTGIVFGLALAGGLVFWTAQRIGEAKTVQSDVEAKRSADSEKAAALAREPAKVTTVRGVAGTWQPRVELDGTLQAEHEASLGFKVGGLLRRVAVEVGDEVRAGALLGQLDQGEAVAQSQAAEAQVRAAESSLALAEDGERRTLPLVQSGSFAEANGVQATRQRELALAQLDSARAQRALAVAGVANHTLVAPFAGTITQAPTGIGAVVAPGQPLFALVDTSKLKLATTVTENDANLLIEGADVHVATERGEIVGRVTAILSTLDARTRRVPVVAEFGNTAKSGPRLRAGAFVRAWVLAREAIPVLRVPHGVLRPGSQDEVLRVDPSTSKLEMRRVVFSVDPDGSLLVRSGIDASDQLVLDPIPEALAGDLVQVASEATVPSETKEPPPASPGPAGAAKTRAPAPAKPSAAGASPPQPAKAASPHPATEAVNAPAALPAASAKAGAP